MNGSIGRLRTSRVIFHQYSLGDMWCCWLHTWSDVLGSGSRVIYGSGSVSAVGSGFMSIGTVTAGGTRCAEWTVVKWSTSISPMVKGNLQWTRTQSPNSWKHWGLPRKTCWGCHHRGVPDWKISSVSLSWEQSPWERKRIWTATRSICMVCFSVSGSCKNKGKELDLFTAVMIY